MTIRIIEFDPHTASDELWAAFNETRRVIADEFWPDEPILDDAETRREVQTTNPMVEFRRSVAMRTTLRRIQCLLKHYCATGRPLAAKTKRNDSSASWLAAA
jgi:hypothetical protein